MTTWSLSVARTLLCLLLGGAAPSASAFVIDWSTLTWAPGSLSNSYDLDPANPGDDVTITLTHNQVPSSGSPFRPDFVDGIQTPTINSNLEGGQGPNVPSLNVAIDLVAQSRYITVTIAFSDTYLQGVEGVSFSIFDIDRASGSNLYVDEIRSISGTAADGITAVAPIISGVGSDISHTGTGLAQMLTGTGPAPDTGAGSNSGNATISFGSTGIRSFTFRWGVPTYAANNPIPMDISFGNVGFSPVPEINPAWTAVGSCLTAVGLMLHHGRRVGKKRRQE